MKRLAVSIMAHVDAGKTTLSEAMLYHTGDIRKQGRVDNKDTLLDNNQIERSRGITVFSKQAILHNNNDLITLLDTPGHTDFSGETERALQVADYAVLLISGTSGIQNHTHTLWQLLKSYRVPTFIFVNKMDISEFSTEDLMSRLCLSLDERCVYFDNACDVIENELADNVAVCDEGLMNEYLEKGNISPSNIARAIKERHLFPCFFGSALKNKGIENLLKALDIYTTEPVYNEEFSATVFKITEDEHENRLTHLKVTGGTLKVKSSIKTADDCEEKVNAIRIYSGGKFITASEVPCGTVCCVTGLEKTYSGQGLGYSADSPLPVLEPLFSYKVELPPDMDAVKGLAMMKKLEQEDPLLQVVWNEQLKEIHIRLMGEIQLEILKSEAEKRFGVKIDFGKGSIAYRETIASPVIGIGHYEPLRHYAEVQLLLEPGAEGSGLRFYSECSEDKLDRNWQRLILTHLAEKTHVGVLTGSPITDMKIFLIAGRSHLKHTEGGDFRQAVYRAVRQGLMKAESVLLEPWYSFNLAIPSDCVGKAMNDLSLMKAEFSQPVNEGDEYIITGTAPASGMTGYLSQVTAYTRGKGRLICIPDGYKPCLNSEEVIAGFNYDPEADIENTPDSIFCSHGAGFNVKWDEVDNYAHISLQKEKDEEPEIKTVQQRRIDASDEELMAIFERTYGKIKRDQHYAMRKIPEKKQENKTRAAKIPSGPEYLLVDGYNIIFAWDELKKAAAENLDFARNKLINILCNYQGFKRNEVIVVFDAYKVKGNKGEVERQGGITIVYTKEAETADMYIEKATRTLGKKHRVRVATSDSLEQLIILGGGAIRVSANEFKAEVLDIEKQIKEYLS